MFCYVWSVYSSAFMIAIFVINTMSSNLNNDAGVACSWSVMQ